MSTSRSCGVDHIAAGIWMNDQMNESLTAFCVMIQAHQGTQKDLAWKHDGGPQQDHVLGDDTHQGHCHGKSNPRVLFGFLVLIIVIVSLDCSNVLVHCSQCCWILNRFTRQLLTELQVWHLFHAIFLWYPVMCSWINCPRVFCLVRCMTTCQSWCWKYSEKVWRDLYSRMLM